MLKPTYIAVKSWMSSNLTAYKDECGELNITKLAEDAIQKFSISENDEEAIFEMSASF